MNTRAEGETETWMMSYKGVSGIRIRVSSDACMFVCKYLLHATPPQVFPQHPRQRYDGDAAGAPAAYFPYDLTQKHLQTQLPISQFG